MFTGYFLSVPRSGQSYFLRFCVFSMCLYQAGLKGIPLKGVPLKGVSLGVSLKGAFLQGPLKKHGFTTWHLNSAL